MKIYWLFVHWKIFLLSKSEKWQNWNYTASQQTTCDEETANKQHCVIYWFLCVLWRAMRHFLRYRIYIIYYEHYKHGVFLCLGTSHKGWWSWCRDLNCVPDGRMEETTWTSSDYMDEDSPRWCQVLQAHTDWDSQRGLCWKFWLRVVLCLEPEMMMMMTMHNRRLFCAASIIDHRLGK